MESSLAVFLHLIAEAYEREFQSLHPLPFGAQEPRIALRLPDTQESDVIRPDVVASSEPSTLPRS